MPHSPVFQGFGHHLPVPSTMPVATEVQRTPKISFNIDSILSRTDKPAAAPIVFPERPFWQAPSPPAAVHYSYPYGALPYPPVWLYKSPAVYPMLPQLPAMMPRGDYMWSDPMGRDRGLAYGHYSNDQIEPETWNTAPYKTKRVRTVFTPEQLERLEKEFLKQQYMVGTERVDLASTLSLTETQVKVWFQNRRIKWRKQSLEQKKAKLSQFGVIPPAQASDHTEEKEMEEEEDDVDVEL